MKHNRVQMLVGVILMTSVGLAAAADKVEGARGYPVLNKSSQSQLEQRESQQSTGPHQDVQNIRDNRSMQGYSGILLESDQDRLRELEREISEEQLRDRDRNGDRLQ